MGNCFFVSFFRMLIIVVGTYYLLLQSKNVLETLGTSGVATVC